ncbi:hypothetical protein [Synechococcus sp. WH 5701]|uniref:hypothetical protein n=1 Tax=Synechococcus sp. WH 5701 TaxID=69042 RepID=UPI001E377701|nr:hypothetical protein [Synechococcus sp. WH 5701]
MASDLVVLTAIDGVRCDRSDESLGLAIQEEWWRAIDLLPPPTEGLNNGTRNESLHSVAVDTKMLFLMHVELPIEAAVRPMPSNGGVGNEGVFYEHASTDQSPRREKSGR